MGLKDLDHLEREVTLKKHDIAVGKDWLAKPPAEVQRKINDQLVTTNHPLERDPALLKVARNRIGFDPVRSLGASQAAPAAGPAVAPSMRVA